jgi:hypothetical protein
MGEIDVSAVLASCGDAELTTLLDAGRPNDVGVGGGSSVCHVDGVPVFAKRIPLTDRELATPRDTANLYDVPTHCQYGIRGPGFNGWRELEANILVGDCPASFPRLYHWRVLPGRAPVAAEHEDADAVVAWYGGSPAVRARLAALAAAPSSLVLFQEYIPYPLRDWWRDDPVGKAPVVERQFAEITGSLRDHELLHMDGHVENMRSDGERIYLTDFGLATSPRFRLSEAEREFAARNASHDAGYASMVLVNWLVVSVCGVPLPTSGGPVARNEYVIRCARGDIPADVPPVVAAILARHAPVAARMNAFYWRLFDGEMDAEFPG